MADIKKKNINRDYIVDVSVKNSTVSTNGNLMFYITDKHTSNIYFKLDIGESTNKFITDYGLKENSDDYELVLRVIKPNRIPKEMGAIRRDKESNFFIADLPEDYKDIIGTYICELFIKTNITTEQGEVREEINTTNRFTYEVIKSIMNDLDEGIETDPNYPLIGQILDDFREIIDNQAEENRKIINQAIQDIQKLDCATNTSVDERIAAAHKDKVIMNVPINNVLTLTADRYQKAVVYSDTEIVLPTGYTQDSKFTTDDYVEIHLFLTPSQNVEITLPIAKYQTSSPIMGEGIYEYIFTYIGTEWLAGVIAYV